MKQITSVGPHGATVTILQRRKGGKYILRWTDPMTGRKVVETTDFVVLTKAIDQRGAAADIARAGSQSHKPHRARRTAT